MSEKTPYWLEEYSKFHPAHITCSCHAREREAFRIAFEAGQKSPNALPAVMEELARLREIVGAIDKLRADEGDSVEICCDNPDFNGQPNCLVVAYGGWTNWYDARFAGETLVEALQTAVASREAAEAAMGRKA